MKLRYSVGAMTSTDFRRIRYGLELTQLELAVKLGYAHKIRVSEFERSTNPVPIPLHIQEAMIKLYEGKRVPQGVSTRVWGYERAVGRNPAKP